jgi:uncharacterized protein (DUF58 family)
MEKKNLNLDIGKSVSELEEIMKQFMIKKIIYKIIFRGKGLEFDSYRDYSPDDDAVDIDWRASQRCNKLLVKQYIEERDLKIMFIIDVGDNMVFGSTDKIKCEYAAELSAALSHLIMNYGDRIGFAFFSENTKKIIMPKQGKKQFNLFVDELSNPVNYGDVSNIDNTLDFLIDFLDKSISVVVLVSDFIKISQKTKTLLELFAGKFETIGIMVRDPLDEKMPFQKEEVVLEDAYSHEQMIVDPSLVKKTYDENARQQEESVKKIFKDSGIDFLELTTDKPFAPYLAEFLKERLERRRFIVPR